MDKHLRIIVLIILVLSIVGLIVMLPMRKTTPRIAPTPTPPSIKVVMAEEEPTIVEVGSPDGKWALRRVNNTFTMIELATGEEKVVFDRVISQDSTISIPLNTFSPNDKYIFLKEDSPTGTKYWVLPGDKIEISSLFSEKYPEYVITDVTGWGGYTQIVVNTDKVEGGIGPTFWFDAGSHSFYKLGRRFN